MEIDFTTHELEPILLEPTNLEVDPSAFFEKMAEKLKKNPQMVQPVRIYSPETKKVEDFFISIVEEKGKCFLQIGEFSTPDLDSIFIDVVFKGECDTEWMQVQPGIYRTEIPLEK
jgi:hypothetical protein